MKSVLKDFAVHFFFPQNCPICGKIGSEICSGCLSSVIDEYSAGAPRCSACDMPAPCRLHAGRYEVRSLVRHSENARALILLIKYNSRGHLAFTMGERMASLVRDLGEGWVITTVPSHNKLYLRPHGDTHLAWLARGLSARTGYPVRDLLKWRFQCRPQKEQLDRAARKALRSDCFAVRAVVPRKVILLDDVTTTGSTLLQGARCLYEAGAQCVVCLTWSAAEII